MRDPKSRLVARCRLVIAVALATTTVIASGASATTEQQAARIDAVTPAAGRPADRVTIAGIGFGGPNVQITVGGIPAAILAATGYEVTFVIPAGVAPGTTVVTATNPGGRVGSIAFQVLEGILLAGDPTTHAIDATFDLLPIAAKRTEIEAGVIVTRLALRLEHGATVGEINAALADVRGGIVSMSRGFSSLTIAIPRQPTIEPLSAVAHNLENAPGIRRVFLALEGSPDVLPVPRTDFIDLHLLPVRFPAAWNARALIFDPAGNCRQRVPVLIADYFRRPPPTVTEPMGGFSFEFLPFTNEVPHYLPSPPDESIDDTHGYTIGLVLGGLFNEKPRTGANPFSQCLDVTGVNLGGLDDFQTLDRLAANFPSPQKGKFVVNFSLSFPKQCRGDSVDPTLPCAPTDFGPGGLIPAADHRAYAALHWKEKTRTRWADFLIATSAGNVRDDEPAEIYPALRVAASNSAINTATLPPDRLIDFVADVSLWGPTSGFPAFPNLHVNGSRLEKLAADIIAIPGAEADNVLMVGSTSQGSTLADLGESAFSNSLSDVKAVGESVPDVESTPISGTSFAAPQVAGLASYLWLLSADLRDNEPSTTTRQAIVANVRDTGRITGIIDAFATILSLDQAVLPTPNSAPVRLAILDARDDDPADFDEGDLALFLFAFVDSATGQPVEPTTADFSRFDLNGDGFSGGSRRERFDLDRLGSTRYGTTSYTTVQQTIEGQSTAFDENGVTDLEILCYYAYSDLYTGSAAERGRLLAGRCAPITVEVDPPTVTLTAGATQQFSARVRGAFDVRVTWTATGGTIDPNTGLFTAGSAGGVFSVRAISVADAGAFGDAVVTVSGGRTVSSLVIVARAGQITAEINEGGVFTTIARPIADAAGLMSAVAARLTGVGRINLVNMVLVEPAPLTSVSFTQSIGIFGVQNLVPGGTFNASLGDVGSVTVSGDRSRTSVNLQTASSVGAGLCPGCTIGITGTRVGAVNVGALIAGPIVTGVNLTVVGAVEGVTITATSDCTIAIHGTSTRAISLRSNTNLSLAALSAGDIEGLTMELNGFRSFGGITAGNIIALNDFTGSVSIMNNGNLSIGAIRIGNIARDLFIQGNFGFDDIEAFDFANARSVGGLIRISDNRK